MSKALRELRREMDVNSLGDMLAAYSEMSQLDGEMCLVFVDGNSGYQTSNFENGTFYLEYGITNKSLLAEQKQELQDNLQLAIKEIINRYGYVPEDRDSYFEIVDQYFA